MLYTLGLRRETRLLACVRGQFSTGHTRSIGCGIGGLGTAMMGETAAKIIDAEGTVKWFDPKKGFGFIVGPDGQDIFVHYTRINGEGFRVLKDGAKVRYDAEMIDKGWHASRVICVDIDPDDTARKSRARTPRR